MAGSYMTIVNRCMAVITNQPGGVTWARLTERVDILSKASNREKVRVFQHLKEKNVVWNNQADDMSDTLFMLASEAPAEEVTETGKNTVSIAANAKKSRLERFQNIASGKPTPQATPAPSEPVTKKDTPVAQPTSVKSDIFEGNSFYNEDEVMAEMAWHVLQAGDHGLSLTALRMSVPEYSDSSDEDRIYLINTMRQRFNVGFYQRLIPGDADGRTVKVLAVRAGGAHNIERSDWFIKQNRGLYNHPPAAKEGELKTNVAKFGAVGNSAMADALASIKAIAVFNENSGNEPDEYDEEDNDSFMETEGTLPAPKVEPLQPTNVVSMKEALSAPAKPTEPVSRHGAVDHSSESAKVKEPTLSEKVLSSKHGTDKPESASVTPEAVSSTADTLRLIADQLERQAANSKVMFERKARFDALMAQARNSAQAIQSMVDNHNTLLDNLQQAADDLTSL